MKQQNNQSGSGQSNTMNNRMNQKRQTGNQAKAGSPRQTRAHSGMDMRKTFEPDPETGNKNGGPKGEDL